MSAKFALGKQGVSIVSSSVGQMF